MNTDGSSAPQVEPRETSPRPARKARRLYIHGRPWWYKIGRCYAHIWNPSGEKHIRTISDVRGLPSDVIDRGQYKKTRDGMVCPSHVERYIVANMATLSGGAP